MGLFDKTEFIIVGPSKIKKSISGKFKLVRWCLSPRLRVSSDLRICESGNQKDRSSPTEMELEDGDARGKHRILAELGRVEEEVRFLEKELGELGQTDIVSTVCEELLCLIEKSPDPLLPLTNGPLNLGWDRWFEGPNGGDGCSCFIL